MPDLRTLVKTLAVNLLDMSGTAWLLKPFYAGRGAILAFHRVLPAEVPVFVPANVVRAGQLRGALQYVVGNGLEIIPLDEVPDRLRRSARGSRRFIAITLDDGYRDNLLHALPIFREFSAPFTVYPATGFVDRTVGCWPVFLEALLPRADRIVLEHHGDGRKLQLSCATAREKAAAFGRLRQCGWAGDAVERGLAAACTAHGLTPSRIMDEAFLSWEELGTLARDPLASIGVHTVSHASLGGLPADRAAWEIQTAREQLSTRLGIPIRHIAYPYGSGGACGEREYQLAREMGFSTGVITSRGNLQDRHQFSLWSLPRHTLSMVRHSANERYLRVSLYGVWDSPLNGIWVRR
ncbi:MAG TPA: polysaccharide deacetylase family protein [Armatimonadota bacterium]|jgi:peptidoglycan/xylan/chitin deacetylase (PgdA/CDA1 family)